VKKETYCKYCKNKFIARTSNQVFCNKVCSYKHYRKKYVEEKYGGIDPVPENIPCNECGKLFTPRNVYHKYCSKACGNKVNKRKYKYKKRMTNFKIFERDGFRCVYCGKTSYEDEIKLTIDHVKPQTKNGEHTMDNLVTSCDDCNVAKSDIELGSEIYSDIKRVIAERNRKCGYTGNEIMYL